jgi:hypothetical protein
MGFPLVENGVQILPKVEGIANPYLEGVPVCIKKGRLISLPCIMIRKCV